MAKEEGEAVDGSLSVKLIFFVFFLVVLYSFGAGGGEEYELKPLFIISASLSSSNPNSCKRLLSGDLLLPENELIMMSSSVV